MNQIFITKEIPFDFVEAYLKYMFEKVDKVIDNYFDENKFYIPIKDIDFHHPLIPSHKNYNWVKVHHIHYGLAMHEKWVKWHMRDPEWKSPFSLVQAYYLQEFGYYLVDESNPEKSHTPFFKLYINEEKYIHQRKNYVQPWHGMD